MSFKLKTMSDDPYHLQVIIWGQAARYCGYSHCTGDCEYPALMLTHPTQGEFKAHSNMVAAGPVWQKKPWTGAKVQVLDLFPEMDPDVLLKMWWW